MNDDFLNDLSMDSDLIDDETSTNDVMTDTTDDDIIEPAPKRKAKKDKPTQNEINQMSDEDIVNNAESVPDDEVKALYDEFMGVLSTNDKIVSDQSDKIFCPTGIDVLDASLGGGLVIGGLSILVGAPGCGKSMIAMQTMAQAQKKLKDCCLTVYIDSEESTTTERLAMLGVNRPKVNPITQLTLEDVFKTVQNLCNFKDNKGLEKAPAIVVWDSIANTLTQKEFEVEDVNAAIGYKARFLTHYLPQYVKKCAHYNIGLVAVNQLRDVISMGPYSAPRDLKMLSAHKSMPGGNSLKYNAFHLLELKVKSVLDPNKPNCKFPFDGIEVMAACAKNKAFRPGVSTKLIGNFNRGFSNFWSNYSFLTETKRLKVGAWNTLVNLPTEKFRTKDAVAKYKEGGAFREAFDKEVHDAIKIEILDRYKFDTEDDDFI